MHPIYYQRNSDVTYFRACWIIAVRTYMGAVYAYPACQCAAFGADTSSTAGINLFTFTGEGIKPPPQTPSRLLL